MPVYEYQCDKCGKVTESLRRMSDADGPLACEHCGSRKMHRMHSVFSAASGVSASGGEAMPMGGCGRCGDPNGPCGLS